MTGWPGDQRDCAVIKSTQNIQHLLLLEMFVSFHKASKLTQMRCPVEFSCKQKLHLVSLIKTYCVYLGLTVLEHEHFKSCVVHVHVDFLPAYFGALHFFLAYHCLL